jgi:hypothetical protein
MSSFADKIGQLTWRDFHPLDCSLAGRYPDPYVKISLIRFLGSNPFYRVGYQTGDTQFGA